jgi:hypothetical protein
VRDDFARFLESQRPTEKMSELRTGVVHRRGLSSPRR